MPAVERIPLRKGEVNIVTNEHAAFLAFKQNCKGEEGLVISTKNPRVLRERYSISESIWITYFGHGVNSFTPERLEFEVMDAVQRGLKSEEPCVLLHGVEYLAAVLGKDRVISFVESLRKTKKRATVIVAVNGNADLWGMLGEVVYRKRLRVQDPKVILGRPRGPAFKISREDGNIVVKTAYEAEDLIFRGAERFKGINSDVHLDCLDFIISAVGEGKAMAFLKDLEDIVLEKGHRVYITPTPEVLRSKVISLVEETGTEVSPEIIVGRDREITWLSEKLGEALMSRGSTIFISGEAGIGKTTLVNHAISEAVSRGFLVMRGRAYYSAAEPYMPINDALKDHIGDLRDLITPGELQDGKGLEARRASLFHGVTERVMALSKKFPLLIFLDDIHWMDSSSLKLLHYMAEHLRGERVVIILTYRPEDATKEMREVMWRMSRDGLVQELKLRPLTRDETVELVRIITGSEENAEWIYRKTGGNPLFIKELLNQISSQGIPSAMSEEDMPRIILDLTRERMSKLGEEEREMLKIASLIGDHVEVRLLARVSGRDEFEIIDIGERAMKAGIWTEDEMGEGFAFKHSIMRDGISTMISPLKRRYIHRKIAKALEEMYGEERYPEVARHYLESGDVEKAYDAFMKAGERAEKLYAYEEAIRLYNEALKIKKTPELLERLGHAHGVFGEYDEARKYLWEALKLVNEPEMKKRILGHLAKTFGNQGDFKKALKYIDAALSVDDSETAETARLFGLKGWIITKSGRYQEALEYLNRERDIAEKIGDIYTLALAHEHLGILHYRLGEYEEAIGHLERALEMSRDLGDKFLELASLNNLGIVYDEMGNTSEAIRYYETAAKMAERIGDRYTLSALLNNLSVAYQDRGDLKTALKYLEKALDMSRSLGDQFGIALVYENLASVHLEMGNLDEALKNGIKALQIGKDIESEEIMVESSVIMGEIHLKMGDLERAENYVRNALEMARSTGSRTNVMRAYRVLGKIYAERGDFEEAMEYLQKSLPAEHGEDLADRGMSLYEMGLLKIKMGADDEGKRLLEEARNIFNKLGLRGWEEKVSAILERKVN